MFPSEDMDLDQNCCSVGQVLLSDLHLSFLMVMPLHTVSFPGQKINYMGRHLQCRDTCDGSECSIYASGGKAE